MAVKNKSSDPLVPQFAYDEDSEYSLVSETDDHVGTLFVEDVELLKAVIGNTLELDGQKILCTIPRKTANNTTNEYTDHEPSTSPELEGMSTQDRYLDARLAGIESKLDARMDAIRDLVGRMEQSSVSAEKRYETHVSRQEREMADIRQEFVATRKHSTQVAIGTVAGVFGAIAIVVTLAGYWISEQGSYAKSFGETQVEIQQAAQERAEFREAVQSIQQTQQSIMERLPAPQGPSVEQ